MNNYAVGAIDMERCFMPKAEGKRLRMEGFGELPVPGGEETVMPVNYMLTTASVNEHALFYTVEAHPEDTAHFSETPNYVDSWPKHGRAGDIQKGPRRTSPWPKRYELQRI